MPRVYCQGGQGGSQEPRPGGQKPYGYILHRPGVDKEAQSQSPEKPQAVLLHDDTKAEAQAQVAGHDRHRV